MNEVIETIPAISDLSNILRILDENSFIAILVFWGLVYLTINLIRVIIKDIFNYFSTNKAEELINQCNRTLGACESTMRSVENKVLKVKKKKK